MRRHGRAYHDPHRVPRLFDLRSLVPPGAVEVGGGLQRGATGVGES